MTSLAWVMETSLSQRALGISSYAILSIAMDRVLGLHLVHAGSQKDRNLGLPIGSNVHLKHFHNLEYLQNDGAHVQAHINAQNGTVLEHNWSHDTIKYGLRFDGSYPGGYNSTVRCNVLWKTRALDQRGRASY